MRRALVLPGGGAKGSWQVGACEHLIVERGYWFDVVTGVSAGAVNAATLAQARNRDELSAELEHLRSVWLSLRGNHDVYRRRWLGALGTLLARQASLYQAGPLRGVLEGHIDPSRVAASPITLRVGYVDLLSGVYRTAGNDHPTLVDAVLASCALPLVFPPVPLQNGAELAVDGGLRGGTPLADALRALAEQPGSGEEPDEIWVVTPHTLSRVSECPRRNWLWVALRSLSVVTSQPFPQDVDRADEIHAGRPSPVRIRVVHPQNELRGPSLDFDAVKLRAWYEDGLRTARAVSDEVAVARAP
jgi:predicted acylesterase/phospholipase RssA